MVENWLYYGDNLDILRRYVKDESVDLVYLDPPFNSNQNYNVLFAEKSGVRSSAQIKAFGDTWKWDEVAAQTFEDVVEAGGKTSQALQAFRQLLGTNDMLAYLSMMAPRLVELRRVLKPTGSLYLHCDPTASHYLKMLMDAIFDVRNFRNEIIWKRTFAHGGAKRYGPVHDVILFYSRSDDFLWTDFRQVANAEYLEDHFKLIDPISGRKFQPISLTGAGIRQGESGKPWRGINPTAIGRHWALPGKVVEHLGVTAQTTQEKLDALDQARLIYWPQKEGGTPRLKQFADEVTGAAFPDIWVDIPPISAQAAERLGYPTQKPLALLERIIQASSNEGDVVLDPFCGCGTTIDAAQKLNRHWIGIDITSIAINLIKTRLVDAYGADIIKTYKVRGEPTTFSEAQALADNDKYQFQWWILGLVGARGVEEKKGADHGIDGRLYFHDETGSSKTKQVIFSVKGGHTNVKDVRDLRGVIDREKAEIGVLLTMQEPTQPMRTEASGAGFYQSPWGKHPRLQILTTADLMDGKRVDMPPLRQVNVTFKQAPKAKGEQPDMPTLFE